MHFWLLSDYVQQLFSGLDFLLFCARLKRLLQAISRLKTMLRRVARGNSCGQREQKMWFLTGNIWDMEGTQLKSFFF